MQLYLISGILEDQVIKNRPGFGYHSPYVDERVAEGNAFGYPYVTPYRLSLALPLLFIPLITPHWSLLTFNDIFQKTVPTSRG